jgi:hypothetical protein
MNFVSRWALKKEKVDDKVQYVIYRQWLWKKRFHARFDTKLEAVGLLEKMIYPLLLRQA